MAFPGLPDEGIADAPQRPDILRRSGVLAQFAPQRGNVHVDGAVVFVEVPFGGDAQEILAGKDASRFGNEREEDLEFRNGQVERFAVKEGFLGVVVHGEVAHAEDIPAVRFFRRRAFLLRSAAPQHGPDARQQFPRGKRLGHIVVRADFQRDDAVGFLVVRREHDHRRGLLPPDAAQHVQPVDVGQEHVEQDQVEGAPVQNVEAGLPVMGAGEAYGVQFQIIVQKGTKFRIVIDEENPDA